MRFARYAVVALALLAVLAGCSDPPPRPSSGAAKPSTSAPAKGSSKLTQTANFAAVYVNDTHVTYIPVPTVTLTTESKRPDWYLTLKPSGEARAIWTVISVTGPITMPVNMEWVGTYTLNPFKASLKLQPAPKGWDTIYHSDDRYFDMTVSGELSADRKTIKNLVISGRKALSDHAWAVDKAPGPGRAN